jgi:hypothetical protein
LRCRYPGERYGLSSCSGASTPNRPLERSGVAAAFLLISGGPAKSTLHSQLSSAAMAWKQRTAIADAINGNSSTSIVPSPVYVKSFATIRHSKTDPNVARVAAVLNVVRITVDRSDDPDCGRRRLLVFRFLLLCRHLRRSLLGQDGIGTHSPTTFQLTPVRNAQDVIEAVEGTTWCDAPGQLYTGTSLRISECLEPNFRPFRRLLHDGAISTSQMGSIRSRAPTPPVLPPNRRCFSKMKARTIVPCETARGDDAGLPRPPSRCAAMISPDLRDVPDPVRLGPAGPNCGSFWRRDPNSRTAVRSHAISAP